MVVVLYILHTTERHEFCIINALRKQETNAEGHFGK